MLVSDWKVLGNRLLLRVIDPPVQDSSGLTLPESAVEDAAPQTTLAEVVAKGAAVDQFAVGQQVIVLKTWARVEIEADEFIVCDANDDVLLAKSAVNENTCSSHPFHEAGQCPHLDYSTPCNCFTGRT